MTWRVLLPLVWLTSWVMRPTFFHGFDWPKDVAWIVGGFLLATSVSWQGQVRPLVPNRWLAGFFGWAVCSFSLAFLYPLVTMPSTVSPRALVPFNPWPLMPFLSIVASFLSYTALVTQTDSTRRWDRVAIALCYVAGAMALYGIAQTVQLDPWRLHESAVTGFLQPWRPTGTFGNPMVYGQFLALLAPLTLMFAPLRFSLIYILCWIAVVLTLSLSSVLALLLASLVVWLSQRRYRTVVLMLLAGGIAAVWISQQSWSATYWSASGRWAMWTKAFALWKSAPVFSWIGCGLGSVAKLTTQGYWNYGALHNEPLQILFELGLPGVVCVVGYVLTIACRILRSSLSVELTGWVGSFTALLVLSLVGFPLRVGALLMVSVLVCAACDALTQGGSYGSA